MEGDTWRLKDGHSVEKPCIWMNGGYIRLSRRRWALPDKEIMEVHVPYVNGADVHFAIGQSTTTTEASEPFLNLMSIFQ